MRRRALSFMMSAVLMCSSVSMTALAQEEIPQAFGQTEAVEVLQTTDDVAGDSSVEATAEETEVLEAEENISQEVISEEGLSGEELSEEEVSEEELSDKEHALEAEESVVETLEETTERIEEEAIASETIEEAAVEETAEVVDEETAERYGAISEDGLWSYNLTSGGMEIAGYLGSEAEVIIPAAIDDYRVTKIADRAFSNKLTLKSITIPEGITSIGVEAFYGCIALNTINFNAISCTVPEVWIFSGTKGRGVFSGAGSASASGLTVNFGDKVTVVPAYLFDTASVNEYGHTGAAYAYVTEVNFSDSVTKIASRAFYNCKELQKVTIGNGVQSISPNAFWHCTAMKSLVCGDELTTISDEAFLGCTGLESVTFGKKMDTIGKSAFLGCSSLKELDLTSPITTLGNFAFEKCTSLESVKLPTSLTTLGGAVFCDCTNLSKVYINSPNLKVPSIWSHDDNRSIGLFSGSGSAKGMAVEFGPDVKKIPTNLFDTACLSGNGISGFDYAHVASVIIPANVTEIGTYAFRSCRDLKELTIGSGVQVIGNEAFYGCTNLESLTLGTATTTINPYAFQKCTALQNIVWNKKLDKIGDYAFSYCSSLKEVNIPTPVTVIGIDAFYNCTALEKVTLPKTLTQLNAAAFRDCEALNELNVYSANMTVPSIWIYDDARGVGVFSGAGTVQGINVKFGSTVTKVPARMFATASRGEYGMNGFDYAHVSSVTFANSVTEIGADAFRNCDDLATVKIGKGVQTVGANAFYGCSALKSVIIGDAVSTISTEAFAECGVLDTITWGSSLNTIGAGAFENDAALTELNIPEPVTVVGRDSFNGCIGLTKVTIPKTVTKLEAEAFYGCSALAELYVNSDLITVPDVWIYDDNKGCGVFSGAGASANGGFTVTFGEGVTNVPARMFAAASVNTYGHNGHDYVHVSKVILPESIKKIGGWAFRDCRDLRSVLIPNVGTEVVAEAFLSTPEDLVYTTYYGNTAIEDLAKTNNQKVVYLPPKTPELVSGKLSSKGITFTWKQAMGAQGYTVYRKATGEKSWTKLGTTTKVSYVDATATAGKTYTYTARGYAPGVQGTYNQTGLKVNYFVTPKLSTPSNVEGGVKISWGAVTGATSYRVYKKKSDGTWSKLTDVKTASYTDKDVTSGKSYSYTVCCVSADGKNVESLYNTTGKTIKYIAMPKISKTESQKEGLHIYWNKIEGKGLYRVYRKDDSGSFVGIADTAATDYVDSKVANGQSYTYTIKCVSKDGTKVESAYDKTGTTAKYVAPPIAPALFKVVGVVGGRNVTFTSAEPDAVIYYSYTTSSITTKDKKVANGGTVLFTNYYGTVYAKAYYNGRWSNASRLILRIPVVNTPTVTPQGDGKVKITTTTPSCQIYYTTDGTTPSPTNGTKVNASSAIVNVGKGKTVKAIAVRSCFTNSGVATAKSY